MEKPPKKLKKTPTKSLKKTPSKNPKKTSDAEKISSKFKAVPRRKSSLKSIHPKKDRAPARTQAESQHRYYEDLGARIAARAYELYVQRGQEHGHDFEDWLEAERQILPKEMLERS